MSDAPLTKLVLASTSPYRKSILKQLQVPFECINPNYEESSISGEDPRNKALRLAEGKAMAALPELAKKLAGPFIIIGSDQVAHKGDKIFSKPGTKERATDQLRHSSGHWLSFTTAISLVNHHGEMIRDAECFQIKFRDLGDQEIDEYLSIDQPYDCAGSIKAESLGISLIEDTRGRDLNTLLGLPLMLLQEMLAIQNILLSTLRKTSI
jgi:MAF protein